jgi:DNA-binding SARP family transcriptional activator/Tfp pilus assembly protein PilF
MLAVSWRCVDMMHSGCGMGFSVVRFRLLGPLRVWDGAVWVPVRAAQQRLVLAILLIEAGRLVSVDRLLEEVWGERPPRAAGSVLRGYVMRLRRLLGQVGGPLVTHGGGYELAIDDDDLDSRVFDRLAGAGRRALADGDTDKAVATLSDALAMWRGPALADVPASRTVTAHRAWLEQARLAATEDRLGGELAQGRYGEVITELSRLLDEHPLQERLWATLMLALYRDGRRGDALDAYRRARAVLTTELGLEPGQRLQDLHRAILSDDPGLTKPVERVVASTDRLVPNQLPADLAGFSGRGDYLRRLDRLLPVPGQQRSTAVVISAISGTGGIGKTTLAVHWAHRVADRFPDGQLYVNLRGFDPTRSAMDPAEAIRGFLDALDVPSQRIPTSPQAQLGLYRSLLAGRRMLILLDNARDTEQVRPLLPGSAGCLVLVTSRNQLTGLVATDGAQPVTVDVLSDAEARELLAHRLGSRRLAAEPGAVDEIVDRCAGLPLALAIVAARAAIAPGLGLAALARELREGLDGLAGGDESIDVRAVFSWSYRALSTEAQRLFRLLAIHPGPEVSVAAAASLAGVDLTQARRLLSELARVHLVNEPAAGRYGLHDLLRAYAGELANTVDSEADRRAARHRVLDHYLHTAHTAARLLEPHRGPLTLDPAGPSVTVEQLADRRQALAWFGTERRSLLASAAVAAGTGFDQHAWQLPWTLAGFLDLRGHWQDLVTVQTAAVAAAVRLDHRGAQIRALNSLAGGYVRLGRFADAHRQLERAVTLADELGDHRTRAYTRGNLGSALQSQHRNREAIPHYQQALALYREADNHNGQARALNSIGWSHAMLGEHAQALAYCRQSLALALETGDRHLQGAAWDSIGYAHHHLGDHREAADCFARALALHRENGDRHYEAETLTHVGDNHHATGDLDTARAAWREALNILEELGHTDADDVRRRLSTELGR